MHFGNSVAAVLDFMACIPQRTFSIRADYGQTVITVGYTLWLMRCKSQTGSFPYPLLQGCCCCCCTHCLRVGYDSHDCLPVIAAKIAELQFCCQTLFSVAAGTMFLQCALMTKLVETALTCSMCAHMLPLLIRLHLSFLNQSCHVLSAVRALRECAADSLQHQLQA